MAHSHKHKHNHLIAQIWTSEGARATTKDQQKYAQLKEYNRDLPARPDKPTPQAVIRQRIQQARNAGWKLV